MNVIQSKNELRKKYKSFRLSLDCEVKNSYDKEIGNAFLSLDCFNNAKTVLLYASTPFEVNTSELVDICLSMGKNVALPYCIDNSTEMDFYYITSRSELKARTFGVLEPEAQKCVKVTDFSGSICVVPGLAYDCSGFRLGYGKGYYDRFLDKFSGVSVGFVYSDCIEEKLPRDEYDKSVDVVVTQNFIKLIKN